MESEKTPMVKNANWGLDEKNSNAEAEAYRIAPPQTFVNSEADINTVSMLCAMQEYGI